MPKIVTLTGPESTGKSTLCQQLAAHFEEPWVPEYAREYLTQLGRAYEEVDLLKIAEGQHNMIQAALPKARDFLFVDTDVWTIYIWAKVKYNRVDPLITDLARQHLADLYLLCGTDVPWTYDPLRENPSDREVLYLLYDHVLKSEALNYKEIFGAPDERLTKSIELLSK